MISNDSIRFTFSCTRPSMETIHVLSFTTGNTAAATAAAGTLPLEPWADNRYTATQQLYSSETPNLEIYNPIPVKPTTAATRAAEGDT